MNLRRIYQSCRFPRSWDQRDADSVPTDVEAMRRSSYRNRLSEMNCMPRADMIVACRNMAAKELGLAKISASDSSSRAEHVFNAAAWSERADVLQRIDTSSRNREALDRASEATIRTADRRPYSGAT